MNKPTRLILACFFACFSFVVTYAQNATPLQPGTPVERELATKQVHTFTVKLEEKTLMRLAVEQKGIDVFISITSPAGKFLNDYDTPNGPNGPENVSFVALTAGTYSIDIEPLDSGTPTKGRYEVKIAELRKATDDELKKKENEETAIAKSIELLRDLEGTITQIKTPQLRIKARLQAANLLWDDDEKRAAKYLSDATADLKELIASVDANDPDYSQQYSTIWQIRFDMVQLLGEIDPEAALALLYSTAPALSAYTQQEQTQQESSLELSVASQMIRQTPQRAYEIARGSLKQGYPAELVRVVGELRHKDAELASKLTNEIIDKLLKEKLSENTQAAQLTMNLLSVTQQIGNLVVNDKETELPERIPEDGYKALLQKTLDEVLSFSVEKQNIYYGSPSLWSLLHGLKAMGPGLDKVISGSSAAVAKKYQELTRNFSLPTLQQSWSGSVEEVLETIESIPTEKREQLYISLAQRESSSGQTQRARQIINDFVKNPAQQHQWLNQIEQQEITNAITNGKTEEALRLIAAIRPSNRAGFLAQLASNFGPGQKRSTALNVLEQARALLPASPQAQDGEQLFALIEIARAFGHYDSKRAFEIVDPLIDQFNEICVAARTLNGFGEEYYKGEELKQDGNSITETALQMSSVLGSLALADFDRAKAASDRMRLTDVRLKAYLELATQVLQGSN